MSSDSIKQSKPKYLELIYILCLLSIISYTVLWYTDCIVIKVAGEIGDILNISKTLSFREISGDFLSLVFTAVSIISVIMLLLSLLLRKTEKLTFINLSLVCDIISLILFVFIIRSIGNANEGNDSLTRVSVSDEGVLVFLLFGGEFVLKIITEIQFFLINKKSLISKKSLINIFVNTVDKFIQNIKNIIYKIFTESQIQTIKSVLKKIVKFITGKTENLFIVTGIIFYVVSFCIPYAAKAHPSFAKEYEIVGIKLFLSVLFCIIVIISFFIRNRYFQSLSLCMLGVIGIYCLATLGMKPKYGYGYGYGYGAYTLLTGVILILIAFLISIVSYSEVRKNSIENRKNSIVQTTTQIFKIPGGKVFFTGIVGFIISMYVPYKHHVRIFNGYHEAYFCPIHDFTGVLIIVPILILLIMVYRKNKAFKLMIVFDIILVSYVVFFIIQFLTDGDDSVSFGFIIMIISEICLNYGYFKIREDWIY